MDEVSLRKHLDEISENLFASGSKCFPYCCDYEGTSGRIAEAGVSIYNTKGERHDFPVYQGNDPDCANALRVHIGALLREMEPLCLPENMETPGVKPRQL